LDLIVAAKNCVFIVCSAFWRNKYNYNELACTAQANSTFFPQESPVEFQALAGGKAGTYTSAKWLVTLRKVNDN
jgi:hypothetical protein